MIERKPKDIQSLLNMKLVMVLDKQKERILISTEEAARRRLSNHHAEDVICDVSRPLGSFLIELERDTDYQWRDALSFLQRAWEQRHSAFYTVLGVNPTAEESVFKLEEKARVILNSKWEMDDPICKYIAMKIWYLYLSIQYDSDKSLYNYTFQQCQDLISPITRDHNSPETGVRCLPNNELFRWPIVLNDDRYIMRVYKGQQRNSLEYIVADDSLVPLRLYYIQKLEMWRKSIIQCKCCGKFFIASNLRFKLCSQACRKDMELRNRKERLSHVPTKEIDKLCNRENNYWYRRWKLAMESGQWTEDALDQFQSRRFRFQDEKIKKRQQYDMGKITFLELCDWFRKQRDVVDEIMKSQMVIDS